MANLPQSSQSDSMDSLTVTREQFRLAKKDELEYLAQALGNVSGSYTTETINPTAVVLQGTPTLATAAEPAAADSSLRLVNTRWVKQNAASTGTTAPTSPVRGQIWIDTSQDPPVMNVWDDTPPPGAWVPASGGGASVEIGDTPPTAPTAGDMWWNSDDGRLYIYYKDADSSQWVDASPDSVAPPDLWSRTGTTISPKTAGDSISVADAQVTSLNGSQLAGFRNVIINGSALIDQRHGVDIFTTASGTVDAYGPDRWALMYGPAFKMRALNNTGAGPLKDSIVNNAFQITSQTFNIIQPVELPTTGGNGPFVNGSTWTLSFRARSESGAACPVTLFTDFGQSIRAGNKTPARNHGTINVANGAWADYSLTFDIADDALADSKCFNVQLTGGNGASTNLLFGNIQLEPGPVATPFEHRPIGTELALCQRYFFKTGFVYLAVAGTSVQEKRCAFAWPQTMRISPSLVFSGSTGGTISAANQSTTICSIRTVNGSTTSTYCSSIDADAEL